MHIASFFALLAVTLMASATDPVKPSAKSAERVYLTNEAWKSLPKQPLTPAELDAMIGGELAKKKLTPAARTTDEQFLRRVSIDITGKLPTTADISKFAASSAPDKRTKLIDQLLASDDYAKHWAAYWRDVVAAKVTDRFALAMTGAFDLWLQEQFGKNQPWDKIAHELITGEGKLLPGSQDAKNGVAFLMLSRMGQDATTERAAEVARLFLGVQIQCAQCHDHPFDPWKREQFHEFTAYFARVRDQRFRNDGQPPFGFELLSTRFTEHRMPDKDDPAKGTVMKPRFLDGSSPRANLRDQELRGALADKITKDNYYFAAAYVNRIWGELFGQSFVSPVDDLGTDRETHLPAVFTRLAATFREQKYDPKAFLRLVLNSESYQRQIRPGESHLEFAGVSPTRLSAEALWSAVSNVIGDVPAARFGGRRGAMGPFAPQTVDRQFKAQFFVDPSTKPEDVEGSIPQALTLMNNPFIVERLSARGGFLGRLLYETKDDATVLRELYLKILARKPSETEKTKALAYVKKIGSRTEAFEDLAWALLNSTEFQTRR